MIANGARLSETSCLTWGTSAPSCSISTAKPRGEGRAPAFGFRVWASTSDHPARRVTHAATTTRTIPRDMNTSRWWPPPPPPLCPRPGAPTRRHLVELVGTGEEPVVVDLADEGDLVRVTAGHGAQHPQGGGHRVAASLDGQLHDALGNL